VLPSPPACGPRRRGCDTPSPEARWPTADEAARSRWFSPIDHGALHLEQRTWVPAMVPWRATDDGLVTDDVVDWYARFAAGRPGALVVEATGIRDVPSGPLLRIGDDRFIPGLTRLAAAVRAASGGQTRLFIQLIDFLAVKRRPPPDKFFARFLAVDAGHRARLAARSGEPRWTTRPRPSCAPPCSLAGQVSGPTCPDRARAARPRVRVARAVTDLALPHIRALPRGAPGPVRRRGRARARGRLRRRRAALRARLHDGELPLATNTRGPTATAARARARAPAARGDRRGARRVGAASPLGCRMLGDEVIAGGSDLDDAVRSRAASRGRAWTSSASRRAASSTTRSSRRSARPCTPTPARAATSACRR
jgi:hypothetical protein